MGAVVVWTYSGATIISTLLALTAITCLLSAGAYVYLFGLVGVGVGEIATIIIKKAAVMAPIIIGNPFSKFHVPDHYISTFVVAGILMLQGGVILIPDLAVKSQLLILMPFLLMSRLVRNNLLKAWS